MSRASDVIARCRLERLEIKYRHERAIEDLPGIRAIREEKKYLVKKTMHNAIHNIEDGDISKQLQALEERESRLLDSLPSVAVCPLCGDTGFFRGSFCGCMRDQVYREAYQALDIGTLSESFEASDLSLFSETFLCKNGAVQRAKYAALLKYSLDYADLFPHTKKPNLFLTGPTGLGKTYILRSIAKRVHQSGKDVMLIGASDLFAVFHEDRLGEDVNLAPLWNCGLLLLDDLGVEPVTHNVTVEYLLDLLNRRIDNKKHTVVATNLSAAGIAERYGERVYSRLRFREVCDQLVFEGIDVRLGL